MLLLLPLQTSWLPSPQIRESAHTSRHSGAAIIQLVPFVSHRVLLLLLLLRDTTFLLAVLSMRLLLLCDGAPGRTGFILVLGEMHKTGRVARVNGWMSRPAVALNLRAWSAEEG